MTDDPCAGCVSMEEWIQNEDESECRSCLLPPVIQWYRDELQEKGLDNFAGQIKTAVESGDPLLMAKKFDEIKEKVPDNVKERLKEFDCYAQMHKENGDGE
jgi:hypothetical protein